MTRRRSRTSSPRRSPRSARTSRSAASRASSSARGSRRRRATSRPRWPRPPASPSSRPRDLPIDARPGPMPAGVAVSAPASAWPWYAPTVRSALLAVVLLLFAAPTAAVELRAGGQVGGPLLFTDVAAAEVQCPALQWPDRAWLPEVGLQTGLGLSFDGRFVEVPLSARLELVRLWSVGFEVAPGLLLALYQGTTAAT